MMTPYGPFDLNLIPSWTITITPVKLGYSVSIQCSTILSTHEHGHVATNGQPTSSTAVDIDYFSREIQKQ